MNHFVCGKVTFDTWISVCCYDNSFVHIFEALSLSLSEYMCSLSLSADITYILKWQIA